MKRSRRGFTIVEIAIVLTVIGVLLGGILKGQELINNAKVRAITDRQQSLRVSWWLFLDRYAAIPGDFIQAKIYITGAANGDGNGLVEENEAPRALQHLTSAGYLRCPQCTETSTANTPTGNNSLVNVYGGVMSIWNSSNYATRSLTAITNSRLATFTGPRIPTNIMAEVDRKIDDGLPNVGDFVFSTYDPSATANPRESACMSKQDGTAGVMFTDEVQTWRVASSSPPVEFNCGAASFI